MRRKYKLRLGLLIVGLVLCISGITYAYLRKRCYKPIGYTNLNLTEGYPSKLGYDANNPININANYNRRFGINAYNGLLLG